MPLLAVKALRENKWLQRAILAKYPLLAVDEYQDRGSHVSQDDLQLASTDKLFAEKLYSGASRGQPVGISQDDFSGQVL